MALDARVIAPATIFPTRREPAYPGKLLMGAFDAKGHPIPQTVLDRRSGEKGDYLPDGMRQEPPHMVIKKALFAGPLYFHYGHFLIESLARLWYARDNPDLTIVWSGARDWKNPSLRTWQREILDLLNLSNPVHIASVPVQCDILHVPQAGYRYDDIFHPEHAAFLASYDGSPAMPAEKLWLSRSNVANETLDLNTATLERRLTLAGWRIAHPETMSVRQQLDTISRAKIIAGEEGSAFHSILLLKNPQGRSFKIFRRLGPEHGNMRTIGDRLRLDQEFYTLKSSRVIRAEGRVVTKFSPNASDALNFLQVPVREVTMGAGGETSTTNYSVRRLTKLGEINDTKRYLEIGVFDGATFNALQFESKSAVDPKFQFDPRQFETATTKFFEMTSDNFFTNFAEGTTYDLMFIDGLHTFEQTFRDFCSSLLHMQRKTIWLIDDVLPVDVFSAHKEQAKALAYRRESGGTRKAWHGDVYKVVFAIHDFFPNLSYATINTGGNAQCVVWREPRKNFKPRFNDLEKISRLDYFSMRENAELFAFTEEHVALERVKAFINQLRS